MCNGTMCKRYFLMGLLLGLSAVLYVCEQSRMTIRFQAPIVVEIEDNCEPPPAPSDCAVPPPAPNPKDAPPKSGGG